MDCTPSYNVATRAELGNTLIFFLLDANYNVIIDYKEWFTAIKKNYLPYIK